MPSFPALDGDKNVDVLIIGGGLTGLLCAWQLSRAGIDYLLIEADRIAGGTTGKTTAKITSQHALIYHRLIDEFGTDTARSYWQAHEAAIQGYRELAKIFPCDLETQDDFIYATGSPARLEAELDALEQLKIPADFVEELPLPFPTAGAIRFRDQAQFHPLKLLSGLSKELNILEHTPVRGFHGNTVRTDHGDITAKKIIVATHFPIINKHGGYFLKQYQQRSYVLALEGAPALDGMYLDCQENGLSLRTHGGYLLLGGGGHRTGHRGGGWEVLEAAATRHFPDAKIHYR